MIDFTNCERLNDAAYAGANGKKIGILYNGEQYMLKFPPSGANMRTGLSYTNSCISEHIGSSIFNMLGINAQKTILGTFDVNGKTKIVCACKDFTADGSVLRDFSAIKNTVIDSEHHGNGTELVEVLEGIEKQLFVDAQKLMEHFWDMFVVDSLLGNFDRHNGNWGFLIAPETRNVSLAPIYDCGSCLLPQADSFIMETVLHDENELNARIFTFPTSALKLNGRKINYYDFLISAENEDCNAAILRVVPRINIEKVCDFLRNVPYLSDLQRDFYQTYLVARYEKILEPVYEKVVALQKAIEKGQDMCSDVNGLIDDAKSRVGDNNVDSPDKSKGDRLEI